MSRLPPLAALETGAALPDCAAVLELVAGFLRSQPAHARLRQLEFLRDREELERAQRLVAEARAWLAARGSFAFDELDDPAPLLGLARTEGAALDGLELLRILSWLEAVEGLRAHAAAENTTNAMNATSGGWPELAALAEAMPDARELRLALGSALAPNGDMQDAASPRLAQIRRQRARQRQAIEDSLAAHLRQLGEEGVLQEKLVTLRNERFVVPIRAESRRRAPGVVHGASSSGQTLFVEPLETIELNNENIRLRDEEQFEIHRILMALTAQVGEASAGIAAAAAAYGGLEFEMAKARFASAYDAREATFAPAGSEGWELEDARHPWLQAVLRRQGRAVIPLSLRLENQRVLVVSGPNTGGKTVVLKTVGMIAWMAHCGLPVCARKAVVPVLDSIWADIGDVQSLELSLSTFSSHLVNIRNILDAAGAATLVLLDELGTATNPAEGAALAEAVAEALRARSCWTLISTHHDALKAWAADAPTAMNASVGVDLETLRPTYEFHPGIPGLSAGLGMAERLGLPAPLIASARERLSEHQRAAAGYLERLQRLISDAETREAEIGLAELAAAEKDRALERREQEVEKRERRDRQRDRTASRADWDRRFAALQSRLEEEWKAGLAELGLHAAAFRRAQTEAARLRREGAEAAASAQPAAPEDATPSAPAAVAQPGDRVRLRKLQGVGRVLRLISGGYEVEMGRIRMQVADDEVAEVVQSVTPSQAGAEARPEPPAVAELNLIGMRAEEACDRLDKFLDQAILSGVERLRIVHGFGSGALRRAVTAALRAHPQVEKFSHPPHQEGGEGVTLVELK